MTTSLRSCYRSYVSFMLSLGLASILLACDSPSMLASAIDSLEARDLPDARAREDWQPINQGLRTAVRRIVVDPHRPTRLYATAEGRIFRSDDRAEAWYPLHPPSKDTHYEDLALDPRTEGVLYAGRFWGGYLEKSIDGGASWQPLTLLQWLVSMDEWKGAAITLSPSDPGVMYVRSDAGQIARSADGGESWALLEAAPSVTALAIDSSNADDVYVLAQDGRVYRTRDGGSTFEDVSGDLPSVDSSDRSTVAVDPNDADTVIVGLAEVGVFRSTQGGTSWEALADAVAGATEYTLIVFDPQVPGTLYVGTGGQVLRSTDGGGNWAAVFERRALSLALASGEDRSVYVGTDDGVYRSRGGSFVASSAGINSAFVESIAVDAHDPEIAYAVAHRGLYVRAKDGRAWTLALEGPEPSSGSPVIVDGNRAGVAYAEFGGKFVKTEDGGQTWTDTLGDLAARTTPPRGTNSARPIAVARGNSDVIYAVAPGQQYGVLVKTTDGGATWHELPPVLGCCDSMIAVSAEHAYLVKWEGFVSETQDGGQTWSSLHPNLGFIESLFVQPSDPRVLYAIAPEIYPSREPRVLRKSVDGGQTWTTALSHSLPTFIEQLAIDTQGRVYALASASSNEPRTLFVSMDGAETFAPANEGLGSHEVSAIAAGSDCVAYAGTRGAGIFKTTTGAGSCPGGD